MRRPRSTPIRVGAATFALAAVTGMALATPGYGAPPAGPASSTPPPAKVVSSHTVTSHTVTLLTGDVVVLEKSADGRQTATVKPPADRRQMTYQTRQSGGHAYVIPADAMPLLAAGRLDQQLFDVTQLVADGYDDAHVASTPLIVQYAKSRMRAKAAPALPGAPTTAVLNSINAVAVKQSKAHASSFWATLVGSAPSVAARHASGATDGVRPDAAQAAADAVGKVWLDGVVHASLKDSVPQIGAPTAWADGYDGTGVKVAILDTGIDTTHPDLAGKVVAAQNFSSDADTLDHFGHGTHVASIVAGTGAASGGVYKGVAPGATLINAKVLNSAGSGDDASIIAGMEWAAAQGAKVANMSLGSTMPSDGDDPLVQAVDEISRSTGTLFAIAAGNLGSGDSTISSPGWADEAITVGAVDKSDVLANFSSRGPRLGDHGIKPDVTAPGVDIVAARAAGSTLGPVVDDDYMRLSGTSMATPHVAGAAAILAQEHPDYTNRELKDLLISTADPGAYTGYQQGTGRIDVARADRQPVFASPGTLNLGSFSFPHTGQQPVTKTVTYHNDGAANLTLSLSLDLKGKQGNPAPAGMVTLSASSVTVPAGGEASVDVTIHPADAPFDLYGGSLVGTAGSTVVHTSIGAYIEAEMYNVTVPAIAHDGRPAGGISQVELWAPGMTTFLAKDYADGTTPTFRVPAGTYNLMGYIFTMDQSNQFPLAASVVGRPQLQVNTDTTVTLDARPAKKITVNTPKPTAPADIQIGYHRSLNGQAVDSSFVLNTPTDEVYAAASDKVTSGDFEFWHKWTLVAPPIQLKVTKPRQVTLDPQFMFNSPPVDGDHKLPMVYAGYGQPSEYQGRDVRGKLVLVSRSDKVTSVDVVRNAANAGAAAVILFNNAPGLLLVSAGNAGEVPIPALTIDQAPGLALVDLLSKGPATVDYSGTAVSGYEYDLFLYSQQQISDGRTYNINSSNMAQINADYRDTGDKVLGADIKHAIRPWTTFLSGEIQKLVRPLHRTEFVSTGPDLLWWHLAWTSYPFGGEFYGQQTAYQPGSTTDETWFGQVARPGIPTVPTGWDNQGAPAYREGDHLVMHIFPYVDPDQHYSVTSLGDLATTRSTTKLFQGDQLVASGTDAFGTFPAAPGPATYRLVNEQQRTAPWWKYSTDVSTTWTFTSATPASGRVLLPLLQVEYNLPLNDLDQAPDRRDFNFTIQVGHQVGVTGPAIRTVQGWASFDDGANWQEMTLTQKGNGKVFVHLRHPAAGTSSGAVSLRLKATDTAGNAIDQTIIRAYGLTAEH